MAGGALMQLVAFGVQDQYLVGNPTITYFKLVYKRHTNFACEDILQTETGEAKPGRKATWTISRNGDLLSRAVLEFAFDAPANNHVYVDQPALCAIEKVTLEIGGQTIDKLYPEFMDARHELETPASQRAGLSKMLGESLSGRGAAFKAFVDLPFFFATNYGLSLPLIALQYHEVKIAVDFAPASKFTRKVNTTQTLAAKAGLDTKSGTFDYQPIIECDPADDTSSFTCKLYCSYVFLDSEERKRFASQSHEYLIEQCQFAGEVPILGDKTSAFGTTTKSVRLAFNHPTKELLIIAKPTAALLNKTQYGLSNYSTCLDFPLNPAALYEKDDTAIKADAAQAASRDVIQDIVLLINGNERQTHMNGAYYSRLMPYRHHTAVPNKLIHCIPFCLHPESSQPSGSLNFSRIDNAELRFTFDGTEAKYKTVGDTTKYADDTTTISSTVYARELLIFARSYNVLKITSGMGGLAYSN